MKVTAFAPIGAMAYPNKKPEDKAVNPLEDPVVVELSQKHGKSPA